MQLLLLSPIHDQFPPLKTEVNNIALAQIYSIGFLSRAKEGKRINSVVHWANNY